MTFVSDELFERSYETPGGFVDVLAEIEVDGTRLELGDSPSIHALSVGSRFGSRPWWRGSAISLRRRLLTASTNCESPERDYRAHGPAVELT